MVKIMIDEIRNISSFLMSLQIPNKFIGQSVNYWSRIID